jgi:hypothetical protein
VVSGNKFKKKKTKKNQPFNLKKNYITLVHINLSAQMQHALLCASIIKWDNYVMPSGKDVNNLV